MPGMLAGDGPVRLPGRASVSSRVGEPDLASKSES